MNQAIDVKDLRVSYKTITPFSIKRNLLHRGKYKDEIFEALKGISFSVNEGEILGITGRNGSGKSTLLKSMAGIFQPDSGTINLHGNSISLLSIGVGFNGNLTGRKNIELSGMLLGFSHEEVKDKTDEIIEFSELGEFIDKPVRTYSSGMHSKLAFSITACLESDIMLIDEVLSVGDEGFKKKSFNKMKSLIMQSNKTVVIVSHNLQTLEDLCSRMLWLDNGIIKDSGSAKKIIADYKKFVGD